MHLLADRILAMPKTRDPDLERARDMLRLPAPNHAGSLLDRDRPMVDRYVLDEDAVEQISKITFATKDELRTCLVQAPPPQAPCWIEATSMRSGWLILDSGEEYTASCLLFRNSGEVLPVGKCLFAKNDRTFSRKAMCQQVMISLSGASLISGEVTEYMVATFISQVRMYCAVLASSHFVVVRQALTRDTGEARLLRRRKALGRVPFFSYNYVTLPVPGDPCFRGEVLPGDGTGSHQRRHWRHGYWRLQDARAVDGELVPFWVWVEGYEAGNEDLGRIVKERHVTVDVAGVIDGPVFRRGYRMPDFEGRKGQRIKATKESVV